MECDHGICTCQIGPDESYCSESCGTMSGGSVDRCMCGHSECADSAPAGDLPR